MLFALLAPRLQVTEYSCEMMSTSRSDGIQRATELLPTPIPNVRRARFDDVPVSGGRIRAQRE